MKLTRLIATSLLFVMATAVVAHTQVEGLPTRDITTQAGNTVVLLETRNMNGGTIVACRVAVTLKQDGLMYDICDNDNNGNWDNINVRLREIHEPYNATSFYWGPKGARPGTRIEKIDDNEFGLYAPLKGGYIPSSDRKLSKYQPAMSNAKNAANHILEAMKNNKGLQDSDIDIVTQAIKDIQPFLTSK